MEFILESNDKLLWKKEASIKEVEALSQKIKDELTKTKASYFCLWLEGDLGAGKTSFTKHLLYALDLDKDTPVTSPTYTYLNEYEVKEKVYGHMDLYRFQKGSVFEEEELLAHRDFNGFILEWPQNVRLPKPMQASHKLHISYIDTNTRSYSFYKS